MRLQTGIPHEQDMPAPVSTTIFLLFATEREMSDSARLVTGSVCSPFRLRVKVMMLDDVQHRQVQPNARVPWY